MRKHLHLLSSLGYRSRRRFLKHESASGLALCTLAISWKMFFNRSYYLRDVTAANRQKKKKIFLPSLALWRLQAAHFGNFFSSVKKGYLSFIRRSAHTVQISFSLSVET